MSVEILGKNPMSENGRKFVMEDGDWEMLQFVLHNAGVKVEPEWSERDGAGLSDAEDAQSAAQRVEHYLSTHPDERFFLDMKGRVTPPHSMSIERGTIQEFTRFLRESGGFEIH